MLARLISYCCFQGCLLREEEEEEAEAAGREGEYPRCRQAQSSRSETLLLAAAAAAAASSTTTTTTTTSSSSTATVSSTATRWYNMAASSCAVSPESLFGASNPWTLSESNNSNSSGSSNVYKSGGIKMVPCSLEEERQYMVRTYSKSFSEQDTPLLLLQEESTDTAVRDCGNRDECLLCLEDFTKQRPKASCLCACGVNRNAFHLDCLEAWRNAMLGGKLLCPLCNEEIFFDEANERNGARMMQEEEEEDRLCVT